MNEDDIRSLNCDFNYSNYGIFYEKLAEENGQSPEGEELPAEVAEKSNKNPVGFQKIISEENLLSKMWQKVEVDFDSFRDKYEDWLEEEVWTYFD